VRQVGTENAVRGTVVVGEAGGGRRPVTKGQRNKRTGKVTKGKRDESDEDRCTDQLVKRSSTSATSLAL